MAEALQRTLPVTPDRLRGPEAGQELGALRSLEGALLLAHAESSEEVGEGGLPLGAQPLGRALRRHENSPTLGLCRELCRVALAHGPVLQALEAVRQQGQGPPMLAHLLQQTGHPHKGTDHAAKVAGAQEDPHRLLGRVNEPSLQLAPDLLVEAHQARAPVNEAHDVLVIVRHAGLRFPDAHAVQEVPDPGDAAAVLQELASEAVHLARRHDDLTLAANIHGYGELKDAPTALNVLGVVPWPHEGEDVADALDAVAELLGED
mmetsp:Transcript_29673/g.84895  ORF Transcript_29673/g.84895 Transcript_29673/m.84895 type:complete len:262 (-) Transcript_29673:608-1393(-)